MLKRTCGIVLAAVMIFALGACGKEESKAVAAFKDVDQKTGYHVDMEMKDIGETRRINAQGKGDLFYGETSIKDQRVLLIRNEEGFFVLYPDSKTGLKLIHPEDMIRLADETGAMMSMEEKINGQEFDTGEMTLDGKEYRYEEFTQKGISQKGRFLFEKEKLQYMIAMNGKEMGLKIRIFSLDNKVDENLFRVPGDYTITEGDLEEDFLPGGEKMDL